MKHPGGVGVDVGVGDGAGTNVLVGVGVTGGVLGGVLVGVGEGVTGTGHPKSTAPLYTIDCKSAFINQVA